MKPSALTNWEIAVYGLHLLGGSTKTVSTEEVALKCFEMAPDAFSWVKFPQYPDKDIARVALTDARKPKHGSLVRGRAGRTKGQIQKTMASPALDGWMLTESGAKWINENRKRLQGELKHGLRTYERQEVLRKIRRVKEHQSFQRFREARGTFNPSLGEMAELLRCRVDADGSTWQRRFEGILTLAVAAEEQEVAQFVAKCRDAVAAQGAMK